MDGVELKMWFEESRCAEAESTVLCGGGGDGPAGCGDGVVGRV